MQPVDGPEPATEENAEPSEELYRALGYLVFSFTELEETLQFAIQIAFDSDEVKHLITGLTFRSLIERFSILYREFQPRDGGEIGVKGLCAHLNRLNEDRNRQIHSTWGFWAGSGRPARTRRSLRANAGEAISMETVEPAALKNLGGQMKDATDKLWEVALDFQEQWQTVRSTARREGGGV